MAFHPLQAVRNSLRLDLSADVHALAIERIRRPIGATKVLKARALVSRRKFCLRAEVQ